MGLLQKCKINADSNFVSNFYFNIEKKISRINEYLKLDQQIFAEKLIENTIKEIDIFIKNKINAISSDDLKDIIILRFKTEELLRKIQKASKLVYFTKCTNKKFVEDQQLGKYILDIINSAENIVRIESPWIWGIPKLLQIIDSLLKRNCKIEILTRKPNIDGKKDNEHSKFLMELINRKVHVVIDYSDHRKIVIADDKIAYLGNANLTKQSFEKSSNLGLIITDKEEIFELIKKFDNKFKESMKKQIFPLYSIKLTKIRNLNNNLENINLKAKFKNEIFMNKNNKKFWKYHISDDTGSIELISWDKKLDIEFNVNYLIIGAKISKYLNKLQIINFKDLYLI
ncbi:MAG: phospholipase D-like domain-containing protein [Candidatus Helarchaeota archaeon]